MARKLGVAVLVLLAALTIAGVASAREVVLRDAEGRTIRFDVRADADVQWYADLLRRAAHGDEIERVTVRIVDWDEIATRCASYAAGCYARQEREPRRDGRPRGTQLGHRAHGRPRVRASRRRESPPRRARRAERDAALVEGARNGIPRRRPERARPLRGRLGALDQRGLRRGLRVHEPQGPLQDRVARAPEHDGAAGDPCRSRSGGAAQDHHARARR